MPPGACCWDMWAHETDVLYVKVGRAGRLCVGVTANAGGPEGQPHVPACSEQRASDATESADGRHSVAGCGHHEHSRHEPAAEACSFSHYQQATSLV
jgi:hypothetical protein